MHKRDKSITLLNAAIRRTPNLSVDRDTLVSRIIYDQPVFTHNEQAVQAIQQVLTEDRYDGPHVFNPRRDATLPQDIQNVRGFLHADTMGMDCAMLTLHKTAWALAERLDVNGLARLPQLYALYSNSLLSTMMSYEPAEAADRAMHTALFEFSLRTPQNNAAISDVDEIVDGLVYAAEQEQSLPAHAKMSQLYASMEYVRMPPNLNVPFVSEEQVLDAYTFAMQWNEFRREYASLSELKQQSVACVEEDIHNATSILDFSAFVDDNYGDR